MMSFSEKNQILLEKALIAQNFLANHLPGRVQLSGKEDRGELFFQILCKRARLLHRVGELAKAAVTAFSRQETLSGIILTRALMETTAYLEMLHHHLSKTLKTGKWHELRTYIENNLREAPVEPGNSNARILFETMSVLSGIDALEKYRAGFRWQYDALCDFAVPVFSGASTYFGSNCQPQTLQLDVTRKGDYPLTIGLTALQNTLTATVLISESIERDLDQYKVKKERDNSPVRSFRAALTLSTSA